MKRKLSKTKLKNSASRKTNPILSETIFKARKNPNWIAMSKILASSTRNQTTLNLFQIDKQTTTGDTVVVLGKVLSKGELTKKLRICALAISETALEKLKKSKSEFVYLGDEISKNPKAEGIKLLR